METAIGPDTLAALSAVAKLRRIWAPERERQLVDWAQGDENHVTIHEVAKAMGISTLDLYTEYPDAW